MAPAAVASGRTGVTSSETNVDVAIALVAVVAFTALGAVADRVLKARQLDEKQASRPRLWVLCMLLSSYALLVPGLVMNLISWQLSFSFFGVTMPVSLKHETTLQLVRNTAQEGAYMAATFITVYAMVIPALKLLLLAFGLAWQYGDAAKVRWARRCILLVQFVSKWASPDMFAYIVMMSLFRGLNKPPHLLSDLQLGLGFSCFSIFCLGSTLSSLGLRLPELPPKQAREMSSRLTARGTGRWTLSAVAALAISFTVLFGVGSTLPCMELHVDMELLYSNNPSLNSMSDIINTLGLPNLLHEEVNAWQVLAALCSAILDGEVSGAIALVMFGGFALCLPLVDMLLLLFAACGLHAGLASGILDTTMAVSRVLRKLSMLDVAITGIAVVVLALQSFREKGVILSIRWGWVALLGAVLCHYSMAFIVSHAQRRGPIEARPATSDPEVQV